VSQIMSRQYENRSRSLIVSVDQETIPAPARAANAAHSLIHWVFKLCGHCPGGMLKRARTFAGNQGVATDRGENWSANDVAPE
jgi:hypothetical protein